MSMSQINSIESLVRNVEQVAFLLTSPRSRAKAAALSLPSHSITSSVHSTSSSTPLTVNISGGGLGFRKHSQDLIEFDSAHSSVSASAQLQRATALTSSSSSGGGGLQTITEALSMLDGLRADLDRAQMGLTLLSLSVTKLIDIVSPGDSDGGYLSSLFSCCSSTVYDYVAEGFVHVHRDVSGSYVAPALGTDAPLGSDSGSPMHANGNSNKEQSISLGQSIGKPRASVSIANGSRPLSTTRKGGYHHLGGSDRKQSNLFTVIDEDEEETL